MSLLACLIEGAVAERKAPLPFAQQNSDAEAPPLAVSMAVSMFDTQADAPGMSGKSQRQCLRSFITHRNMFNPSHAYLPVVRARGLPAARKQSNTLKRRRAG